MTALYLSLLGAGVRYVLIAVGAGHLFSDDETTQLISALSLVMAAAWTIFAKVRAHDKLEDAKGHW